MVPKEQRNWTRSVSFEPQTGEKLEGSGHCSLTRRKVRPENGPMIIAFGFQAGDKSGPEINPRP